MNPRRVRRLNALTCIYCDIFFFSSRRRHTRWNCELEFRRVLFRSRSAAVLAGAALAAQADPLAVLDAGRDPGLDRARRRTAAGAVAGGAGLVVDQLAAAAAGTGLVRSEERRVGKGCR